LLQAALDRRGLSAIRVCALINDTVGAFIAHAYADPRTRCSVVLGTGTNACYLEPVMGIRKLSKRMSTVERLGSSLEVARRYDEESEGMLINVEWGAFGDTTFGGGRSSEVIREDSETSTRQETVKYLKWTRWDEGVDRASANPGKQHFEKMVAGMYIGDICLGVYQELHPEEKVRNEENGIRTMDSKVCSGIEAGENKLNFQFFEDMQRICRAVSDRSIRLVATMIMAILTHIRTPSDNVVVAIDGSLYTKYHQYKERLQQAVNEIATELDYEAQVLLSEAADQSSVGAAAAIAATQC
jgi:hexokinase